MAWYPGATKWELPEGDSQPAIRPTQLIVHSIIAPWTARRTYEYWRDSTNLESHFGLGYEGDLGQFIGTETRADANAGANRRGDGTGAVSIETASNLRGTDPWTDAQVRELIALGVWLHQKHGLPLRICRSAADPGYGYHSLHTAWSTSGTACPGTARIRQFRETVFPGIVAAATGKPTPTEDDMTPDQDKRLRRIEDALEIAPWRYRNHGAEEAAQAKGGHSPDAYAYLRETHAAVKTLAESGGLTAQQIRDAAKAGAEAALAELADRLTP